MRAAGLVAAAALAISTPLAACGDGDSDLTAPPAPKAGPQGVTPQFVVTCEFSHSAFDDPIVHPNHPGASHLHHFFGATTAAADSTVESLRAGGTSCDQQLDTASYWVPALLDEGREVVPDFAVVYYRPGPDVDPTVVQPLPEGLMMVAGDAAATDYSPVGEVAWTCETGITRAEVPPICDRSTPLRLVLTFPDCWNGVDLDAPDHRQHLARSHAGVCPETHPVPITQVTLSVAYPIWGEDHELSLASGELVTGHGDMLNAWHQDKLELDTKLCINAGHVCGVAH